MGNPEGPIGAPGSKSELLAQHFLDSHSDGRIDTALVQVTGTVLVGVLAFSDEEVQANQDVALCLQQVTAGIQASCVFPVNSETLILNSK